jgi:uncharacterized MAPEG superfamily protein
MTPTKLLLYSAILTWLMIMVASLLRTHGNLDAGFGNREDLPPASPLAGRAERAAKNMLENMVLFTAIVVTAGGNLDRVKLGAEIFFVARLAYWPVYLAGIKYLRTVLWAVSIVGMGLIAATAL